MSPARKVGRPPRRIIEKPSTPGEFIRVARESAGLSRRQLAALAGWHWHTIMRVENGETPVSDEHVLILARALKVNPGVLVLKGHPFEIEMRGTENPPPLKLHHESRPPAEQTAAASRPAASTPTAGTEASDSPPHAQTAPASPSASAAPSPPASQPLAPAHPVPPILPVTGGGEMEDYTPKAASIPAVPWTELRQAFEGTVRRDPLANALMWDITGLEDRRLVAARVPWDSASAKIPAGSYAIIDMTAPGIMGIDQPDMRRLKVDNVVAEVGGEIVIRNLRLHQGVPILELDAGAHPSLQAIKPAADFRIIGILIGQVGQFI